MTGIDVKQAVPDSHASSTEAKTLFAACDDDSDERISHDEFSQLLDELGSTLTETQRRNWFDGADRDRDGFINLEEFADWWLGSS